jgi:N-acetylglutamate synthase-like GNAT family acetyltransferase
MGSSLYFDILKIEGFWSHSIPTWNCSMGVAVNDLTVSPALPAGVTLREADESDISEMMEVVNAAFEEESFFVNRPRTHPAQLAEHFRSGHFLLAHQGAQLIASAYYEVRGERGYIGMLAVRPQHQHSGMGRLMMQAVEQVLRRLGCRIAELSVVDLRTALTDTYRRLGYREAGVEEPPEELRQKLTMPVQLIKMEKQL